jgi:hypothetical protein
MSMNAPAWQALANEKVAEMDALIKRTQVTRAWLLEALQRDCKGVDDCVTITIDESGSRMNVTLSCEIPRSNNTPEQRKSLKLMTMPVPTDS